MWESAHGLKRGTQTKELGFVDEQIFGSARYDVIRASQADRREWLEDAGVCDLLKTHHISHAGVMEARHPFRVSRINPNGTFMMACMAGRGQMLVDGKWEFLEAGQACLLPPFVLNCFRCVPRSVWKFCWVRYDESREQLPIISSSTPVMGEYAFGPLLHAFRGLHAETLSHQHPQAEKAWVDLLHEYVLLFAQPRDRDERITRLWQMVEKNLAAPWTLKKMAECIHVSEEHLRRLCRRHLGRSPSQQLTFLRMQRAQRLLSTRHTKIETVAHEVGYQSVFTFSNSFKKWVGWRPSQRR